jgi:hypothetical protein
VAGVNARSKLAAKSFTARHELAGGNVNTACLHIVPMIAQTLWQIYGEGPMSPKGIRAKI